MNKRKIYMIAFIAAIVIAVTALFLPIDTVRWDNGSYLVTLLSLRDFSVQRHALAKEYVKPFLIVPYTANGILLYFARTLVFTFFFAAFVVFLVLFLRQLKKEGKLKRKPSKTEQLQVQVGELQKQIDAMKKDGD